MNASKPRSWTADEDRTGDRRSARADDVVGPALRLRSYRFLRLGTKTVTILADAKVAPTYRLTSVLPRRAKRTVHKPYIVLSLLQVLDVLTTGIILGVYVGAGREGNPFVSTIFDHAGLVVGLRRTPRGGR